ncbi:MAG: hypothetical protein R2710_30755, partial [Acidimicrobiales bacterium]
TADVLARLSETGLFLTSDPEEHGWFRSTKLAATVFGMSPASIDVDPKVLADAYVASGHVDDALVVWSDRLGIGEPADLVAFVVDHGEELVARADPERLQRVLDHLGTSDDPVIAETIGRVSFRRGDWDRALEAFERCERLTGSLPARLGARLAQIRYLRGEIGPAIAVCERAVLGQGDRAADARVWAWWSSALWLRNEVGACAEKAELRSPPPARAATTRRCDGPHRDGHAGGAPLGSLGQRPPLPSGARPRQAGRRRHGDHADPFESQFAIHRRGLCARR